MESGLIANTVLTIDMPVEQAGVMGLLVAVPLVMAAGRGEIVRPDPRGAEPYFGM